MIEFIGKTERERQDYYEWEERAKKGGEWWSVEPPPREPWFESELALIGGHHHSGRPHLRVVWGGTERSDIAERPQLKYMRTRTIIKGYKYNRKDGTVGYIRKGHQMSDEEKQKCVDRAELVPVREAHQFGRLRWIVERYQPPEKLRQQGRFTHLYGVDGTKVLRDFPNEGVYDCFFVVQRRNHKYRDLDREVLMAVEAMYRFNLREDEAQNGLDEIDAANERTLIGAAEARAVYDNL